MGVFLGIAKVFDWNRMLTGSFCGSFYHLVARASEDDVEGVGVAEGWVEVGVDAGSPVGPVQDRKSQEEGYRYDARAKICFGLR